MDLKIGLSKQITKLNMKTSSFFEETKIRTYITTLEQDIKDLKIKAGEMGYMMWAGQNTDQSKLDEIYVQIAEKSDLIQEQERLIREMAEASKKVMGAGQDTAQENTEKIFCPSCGEAYSGNVNFCKKCGTKLH